MRRQKVTELHRQKPKGRSIFIFPNVMNRSIYDTFLPFGTSIEERAEACTLRFDIRLLVSSCFLCSEVCSPPVFLPILDRQSQACGEQPRTIGNLFGLTTTARSIAFSSPVLRLTS